MKLTDIDIKALDFLWRAGSDCVGVIDSEEKIAAVILFDNLARRGLVSSQPSDDGPVFQITMAGRSALLDPNNAARVDGRGGADHG